MSFKPEPHLGGLLRGHRADRGAVAADSATAAPTGSARRLAAHAGAALTIAAAAALPFAALDPNGGDGARRGSLGLVPSPAGCEANPARTERVRELLRGTRRGRRLLAARPSVRICLAPTDEPALIGGERIVLDERLGDAENAARLGHLLLHAAAGPPLPAELGATTSCDRAVDRAVEAEAEAHALELELRRELGVQRPARRFAFERDFWRAEPHRRTALLRDYFLAHPDGAPGVPGLVRAYRQRCAQLRAIRRGYDRSGPR